MINRIVLVGRATRDPELRRTASDKTVCTFTVAVDDRAKKPDGSKNTSFIPCVVFSAQAESVAKVVRKGSLVGVEGRLTQRSFERQDGSKGTVFEVICDSVQFLEPKGSRTLPNEEPDMPAFDDSPVDNNEDKNLDSLDIPSNDLPF